MTIDSSAEVFPADPAATLETLTVRLMGQSDLPAVVSIDEAASGRKRPRYFELLLRRALSQPALQVSLVAEHEGKSIGYACSMPFRAKQAYDPSVETSIYLAAPWTGRGLGRRLYAALFTALAGEDVHRAYAGITLPNAASVSLHEKLGFERVGLMREVGRKLGHYWDVAWYEKALA